MRWFGDVLNRGPMRDGVLGIGGSGAKTDRGQNLGATQGAWSIFNNGLPVGQQQQATGQADLGAAKGNLQNSSDYWQRLLTGGRTDTAALSAPAISSTLAASDATKGASSQFGSGRSGGDVAQKREASTQTQSKIDDTINQNLVAGRAAGAQGLQQVAGQRTQIGSTELQNALQNLGLSASEIDSIMSNSRQNYQFDTQQQQQTGAAAGQAAAQIALAFLA